LVILDQDVPAVVHKTLQRDDQIGIICVQYPPTPVRMTCATYVEKHPMSPNEPTGIPLCRANIVSQESSTIRSRAPGRSPVTAPYRMTCGRSGLALWHVDEYRLEAIVDDYVRTGDKRHCRYKDFIAASPARCSLRAASAICRSLVPLLHMRPNRHPWAAVGSGRDVHAADANLSARRLAMT
jgi:hypothetical protein